MRVFAGPNGSGKTTIFKGMLNEKEIDLGIYVNADEIEEELSKSGTLDFSKFQIVVSPDEVVRYFQESNFSPVKRNELNLWRHLLVEKNILTLSSTIDSYLAADIAEFIRQQLLYSGKSFTYETVMSHPGKIAFLNLARKNGYRVYLYYIATEDPDINISRVNVRKAQHGHDVSPEVVKKRYYKSLSLLKDAVKNSDRAYIFDNSGENAILVIEITDGNLVQRNDAIEVPNWVAKYLLQA